MSVLKSYRSPLIACSHEKQLIKKKELVLRYKKLLQDVVIQLSNINLGSKKICVPTYMCIEYTIKNSLSQKSV